VIFYNLNAILPADVLQPTKHAHRLTKDTVHISVPLVSLSRVFLKKLMRIQKLPTFYETATVFIRTHIYISEQSIFVDYITNEF
jgi:hypothetical protein